MGVQTGDGGGEFTTGSIQRSLRRESVLALPPIHPDRNEVGWELVENELREYSFHQEHGGRTACRWNEAWARAILGITAGQLRSLQKAHLAPFLTPGEEFSPEDLKTLARRVFGAKRILVDREKALAHLRAGVEGVREEIADSRKNRVPPFWDRVPIR